VAKQPAKGRKTPAKTGKATQTDAVKSESVQSSGPMIDAIPAEVHTKVAPREPKV
jgi:hypothetical protein